MKCPVCGIEMRKKTAAEWVCRNPKCVRYKGGAGKAPEHAREDAAEREKEEKT